MKQRTCISLPAYREHQWLPTTMADLAAQDDTDFEVWICVNQPADPFLDDPVTVTQDNEATLAWLARERDQFPFKLEVIDAVHEPDCPKDAGGVGWARRTLFERLDGPDDPLVISMDADTRLPPGYIRAVKQAFRDYPNGIALAAPYLHPLPEDNPAEALRILRYEIYMRYYQLSLWRIGCPYALLPLGSAMAWRATACRRIGGVPNRQAAEDFYLLQKFRKTGPVIRGLSEYVRPASRPSTRVPFGTGAVVAETDAVLQEQRFPFYDQTSFDDLGRTYALFPQLYQGPVALPIDDFLLARTKGEALFEKMRRNFKTEQHFIKACHEQIDGLKILQFLRFRQETEPDEEAQLNALLRRIGKPEEPLQLDQDHLAELDALRLRLFAYESECQQAYMDRWDLKARW